MKQVLVMYKVGSRYGLVDTDEVIEFLNWPPTERQLNGLKENIREVHGRDKDCWITFTGFLELKDE